MATTLLEIPALQSEKLHVVVPKLKPKHTTDLKKELENLKEQEKALTNSQKSAPFSFIEEGAFDYY